MTRDEPATDPTAPALAQLRGQDAAAFEWLVARTQGIVLGLGQSLGLGGADLDDAAADAYLAVYRALPRFEGRSAVTTWVYQIACRTLARARARLRKAQGRPLTDVYEDRSMATAASAYDRAEANDAIWAAVATLEPRSAMAVELHYRRGMPVDQIAAALDCPEGTVKTLLFRARAALRERLGATQTDREVTR